MLNNTDVLHVVIVALFILLLLASSYIILMNKTLKRLKNDEVLYKVVFHQSPIGIAIVEDYRFLSNMNAMFEKILNREKHQLTALNWVDLTHPEDLEEDMEQFARFKAEEIDGYSMEKRYAKPDGSYTWIHLTIAGLQQQGNNNEHLCIIQDINKRKLAEEALRESERSKSVLLSHLPGMAFRCKYDRDWTIEFVSQGCFELTGYKQESLIYNKEISYDDLIAPEYKDVLSSEWDRVIAMKTSFRHEYEIITASGKRKWVLEMGQGIYDKMDRAQALEGIVIDITEQKERERHIEYINKHDYLTGLNNRKYYEDAIKEMERNECLPLTVMVIDINGVKLINDAFGYSEGDRLIRDTSAILQSCYRPGDVLARIGGDEFGILLPNTSNQEANQVAKSISDASKSDSQTTNKK
jgi:diguanylate cyclase (GGDEF)-like protein/PAS domain S-box-containing protein